MVQGGSHGRTRVLHHELRMRTAFFRQLRKGIHGPLFPREKTFTLFQNDPIDGCHSHHSRLWCLLGGCRRDNCCISAFADHRPPFVNAICAANSAFLFGNRVGAVAHEDRRGFGRCLIRTLTLGPLLVAARIHLGFRTLVVKMETVPLCPAHSIV